MLAFRLESSISDLYGQMSLDEAVLEHAGDGEGPAACFLRFYPWDRRAPQGATFGYSQAIEEIETVVRRRWGGITLPLVRRTTGGGLVYHDGDITFSFVFPWPKRTAPSLIYKNIHLGIHIALKARGIPSRFWSAPGGSAPSGVRKECFAAPESKDLTHEDGTKFLGGALRRRKGYGLYQGSMRPERFEGAAQSLEESVEEGISLQWGALFRSVPAGPAVVQAAERLRRGKYVSDRWNRKR